MTEDPTRPTGVSGSIGCAEENLVARVALLLPAAPAPTDAAVTAARAKLAAAPVADVHDRRLRLPGLGGRPRLGGSRPRPHPRLRPGVVNAALALVVVAVTLAVVSGAVGSPPPAQATARAKLLEAGASAGRATPLTPRRDQFVYTKTDSSRLTTVHNPDGGGLMAVPDRCTDEVWMPVDARRTGGSRWHCRVKDNIGEDAIRRELPEDPDLLAYFGTAAPTWDYLQTLVGPPEKLYQLLAQERRAWQRVNTPVPLSPEELAAGILGSVGGLMGQGGPQLDSVLYQVAAMLPGVRLVDGLVDIDGRTGTGVSVTYGGESTDLIFDPTTGEALGVRTVYADAALFRPAGTVESWSTTTRVVDSVGAGR